MIAAIQSDHTSRILVGAAMMLLLAGAALRKERVPTAVIAFVAGFLAPWGAFFIAGVPLLILAFLLVRAGRQEIDDQGGPRR